MCFSAGKYCAVLEQLLEQASGCPLRKLGAVQRPLSAFASVSRLSVIDVMRRISSRELSSTLLYPSGVLGLRRAISISPRTIGQRRPQFV